MSLLLCSAFPPPVSLELSSQLQPEEERGRGGGREEEQEKEEGARKERGSSWCAPVSPVGVLSEGEGSRAVVTAAGELDPGCSRSHQVGGDEMTARGLEHWRISWGVTGRAMLVAS